MKTKSGFTLVELLIVIVIIAVLAVSGSAAFYNILQKAQDVARKIDINSIAKALEVHYNYSTGTYPLATDLLDPANANWFSSGKMPIPPEGGSYIGYVATDKKGFITCAAVGTDQQTCQNNTSSPGCFCLQSQLGTYVPSADHLNESTFYTTPVSSGSSPTPTPTPGATATPTPTPIPLAYLTPNISTSGTSSYCDGSSNYSGAPGTGTNNIYINLTPLPELGTGTYQTYQGGLYPGGSNTRPAAHEAAGQTAVSQIQPINGKIVFISIGLSNTTIEFQEFQYQLTGDASLNPNLKIVDGAKSAQAATIWAVQPPNLASDPWKNALDKLTASGVTASQVQIAWVKLANANVGGGFPGATNNLKANLRNTVQNLKTVFPNIKVAYLSSRIYGGYAGSPLNPEPYAYESGFAVKWLIEDQINGDCTLNFDSTKCVGSVVAPWLSWGPYLWADGLRSGRSDGLTWKCAEIEGASDGVHPSNARSDGSGKTPPTLLDTLRHRQKAGLPLPLPYGVDKVACQLQTFLKTDSTAKLWFCQNPNSCPLVNTTDCL